MRLMEVVKQILREQGQQLPAPAPAPAPAGAGDPNIDPMAAQADMAADGEESMQDDDLDPVIELPNANMSVSLFRDERKMLFTPQEHTSRTQKIRNLITMLKQKFRVMRVNEKGQGIFEMEFDPRQDFEEAVDYIKQEAENNRL